MIDKINMYQNILLLLDERIKEIKRRDEESLEKQGEKIGKCLHLIHKDILCLQHYFNFFKGKKDFYKGAKYLSIFNYFVKMFWDRIYIDIYHLLDKRKDVLSLKGFFKECGERDKWKKIEKNCVFKKIESNRHTFLAHQNFYLALHAEDRLEHYHKNKLDLSEILNFIKELQIKFEEVLGKILGLSIVHYALGESKEEKEFRELLNLVFSDKK